MLKKDQEKVRTGRKKKNVIPFYKPWYVSNGRVNGSPYDPAALGLMGLPLTARFPVGKPVVPAALTWS